ncbi:MAG: NUDIX domain-containing protein [Saprospiraceae bacterium]|nr:NUDIX domain-containing protein [Saprospiraceae bacterium]MBK8633494.1 NUDIX domain-containing protein [Saprospiraceae bacterium]MBP7643079.1 NUDIX domain-containing protein [Saprospiraceae bacterium]
MKAEIIQKNILSNKWGEYAEYEILYTRTDGQQEIQKREIQDNGDGAAVLLYNLESQKILLLKQFRLATYVNGNESGIMTEVCAGLVENNDPTYTIKKEIKEETGLDIVDVTYLFQAFAAPGAKTERIYFFIAPYHQEIVNGSSQGVLKEQEDIILMEIPFSEAYEGIFTGKIQDSKTIILLQYAKNYLFKD